MEWEEKGLRYEELYRSGRQARNLWKYLPYNARLGTDEAFSDSDGYWIWLSPGWVAYDGADDCGMIHEYTIADLKAAIKTIRRGERS